MRLVATVQCSTVLYRTCKSVEFCKTPPIERRVVWWTGLWYCRTIEGLHRYLYYTTYFDYCMALGLRVPATLFVLLQSRCEISRWRREGREEEGWWTFVTKSLTVQYSVGTLRTVLVFCTDCRGSAGLAGLGWAGLGSTIQYRPYSTGNPTLAYDSQCRSAFPPTLTPHPPPFSHRGGEKDEFAKMNQDGGVAAVEACRVSMCLSCVVL